MVVNGFQSLFFCVVFKLFLCGFYISGFDGGCLLLLN